MVASVVVSYRLVTFENISPRGDRLKRVIDCKGQWIRVHNI